MSTLRAVFAVLFGAATLCAQAPRVNPEVAASTPDQIIAAMSAREEYRPDVQIMTAIVRSLLNVTKAGEAAKAEATKLNADAQPYLRSGNTGEARRLLAHAVCILLGRTWNEKEEYLASLVLRPNVYVADLSIPYLGQIAQRYPASYKASNPLKLRISLAEGGLPGRNDEVVSAGKIIREMGTYDLAARDLNDDPFTFDMLPSNVPEGAYIVVAEVLDGIAPLGRVVAPVYFVDKLQARQAAIEQRLAKLQGHDSTKATILYPFDLARGINARRREVNQYDWPLGVRRSEELLKALEGGKDLLYQAKGDNKRNYTFTEAGEIMPYRVFVPSNWDPGKKVPMVLALHGSALDENNFMNRADGRMKKLGEQYGWIVATPLGYRINGGYGSALLTVGAPPTPPVAGAPVQAPLTPARIREAELSEKDAMNVMEAVAKEYNVDRTRIYIMGNSMGGGGTWYLGAKYSSIFAAMAPCASGINPAVYPFDKVKNMPIMGVAGELDPGALASMKTSIKALQDHGMNPTFVEVKGGTHGSSVETMMPDIFEFFKKYQRKITP